MTREKAEVWVSTHNTAPRIQAWAQAYRGQGPLHLRDLAHPTVLSFPTSPFLATHRPSAVTLWTKSVAATGGKPGPELGLRPAEYGGPRNPLSSVCCAWHASVFLSPPPPLRVGNRMGASRLSSPSPQSPHLRSLGVEAKGRGTGPISPSLCLRGLSKADCPHAISSLLELPRGGESCQLSLSLSVNVLPPGLPSSAGWAHSLAHHIFRDQGWLGHLLGPQKHSSRPPTWELFFPSHLPSCGWLIMGPQE